MQIRVDNDGRDFGVSVTETAIKVSFYEFIDDGRGGGWYQEREPYFGSQKPALIEVLRRYAGGNCRCKDKDEVDGLIEALINHPASEFTVVDDPYELDD